MADTKNSHSHTMSCHKLSNSFLRISISFLLLLTLASLSGCKTTSSNLKGLTQAQLKGSDYGIVSGSFLAGKLPSLPVRQKTCYLYYREIEGDHKGHVQMSTTAPKDDLSKSLRIYEMKGKGNAFAIKLPEGQYEFYKFKVKAEFLGKESVYEYNIPISSETLHDFSVPFSIGKGRITYVGEYHFLGTFEQRIRRDILTLETNDFQDRDTKLLAQAYPALSWKNALKDIASVRTSTSTHFYDPSKQSGVRIIFAGDLLNPR